jgi:hypothetical protein
LFMGTPFGAFPDARTLYLHPFNASINFFGLRACVFRALKLAAATAATVESYL